MNFDLLCLVLSIVFTFQGRKFSDWQAMMRHYIGNKHGVLERYVREYETRGQLRQHGEGEEPACLEAGHGDSASPRAIQL